MIKYLTIVLLLISQLGYAQSTVILPKSEQLIELRKIDEYYKSQQQTTPPQVINGIKTLEKELGVTPIKQPIASTNVAKPKVICKKIKTKSGKYINQCKPVKKRKKYNGKTVPNYSKK